MSLEQNQQKSTIAYLVPGMSIERRWQNFKNAMRTQGSHFLSLRRPNKNPESARQYVEGDPVNMIDWKAFARTDELIIREQRDEASARIRILIDGSSTMNWPNSDVPVAKSPTKLEIATRVGFHLAHIHLRMGDFVELWLLIDNESEPSSCYAPKSPSDVVAIFNRLEQCQFSVTELKGEFASKDLSDSRRADVSYWLGDVLGAGEQTTFLDTARVKVLFHVLSSLETDIDWLKDEVSYFDEGRQSKEYQGQTLRQQGAYLRSLRRWIKKLKKNMRDTNGVYCLLTERTPIVEFHSVLLNSV